MKRLASLFLCGVLFGAGLALSDMINPTRVQSFLRIGPTWDPTLLFVMGGALMVSFPFYRKCTSLPQSTFGERYQAPTRTSIDGRLIVGAMLFGMGWGIGGICPGPALAQLAQPTVDTGLFLISMLAGLTAAKRIPNLLGSAGR